MENYDRLFAETVRHLYPSPSTGTLPAPTDTARAQQSRMTKTGVILVVGHKFGTGSSRKQAAMALRNARISLVIAATIGKIRKRTQSLYFCYSVVSAAMLDPVNVAETSWMLYGCGSRHYRWMGALEVRWVDNWRS
ncbi:hypothetical protein PTTG_26099 [Puccinia triticina 1-1 BBBD Race 1]|uniref:Aconitase_C domain-containing protein n=1 Tax=Puccinia triticina (isolate 1-1 / race 1 (BBBD)) TaxID=630390 RepID=A0A180GWR7_PUCT1|nr:hypothetical protein PTTG_26099 [Puccinia triticina 1-1 BBBD Race 1]